MLSMRLKQEIERHAVEMSSHPLMRAARSGEVSPETVTRYLCGVQELVRATPRHLKQAVASSRELGRPDLEKFFEHKLVEEQGHDRWADNDLARITAEFATTAAILPSPAIGALLAYLERLIGSDPAAYLAYILLAEYGTVLIGPVWTAALKERCNIPSSALSVVDRHAELDKHHVAEALQELDRLLEGQSEPAAPLRALFTAMRYFEHFLDELCEMTPNLGDHSRACRAA